MTNINLHTSPIQQVILPLYSNKNIAVDILRLDLVHPVVSGNKWYKLKEYLSDAATRGSEKIVTYGGAWSNHIVATAAACKEAGFASIGIIRGERPKQLSETLSQALKLNMKLQFISREEYALKMLPSEFSGSDHYIINEGGYGIKGMEGAKAILNGVDHGYTHITTAVGTGTTLAGIIEASEPGVHCIGISVLKNNFEVQHNINDLVSPDKKNHFQLVHDYHFGGYAKRTDTLITFMNQWFEQTNIPSDFVYTGKFFYAIDQLIRKDYFPNGSKLLLIHSGGLQGNRSLPKGTLIFGY